MTNPEINRTIAEACGWTVNSLDTWKAPENTCWLGCYLAPPNYCEDLNAMAEAEKEFLKEQTATYYGIKYCSYLTNLRNAATVLGPTGRVIAVNESLVVSATARQRAEAFLRTLGKWREE